MVSKRRHWRAIGIVVVASALAAGSNAFAAASCDVRAYGATPNATTMNTNAIQAAIDACAKKGGGKVLLDGGIFLSGPIVLKNTSVSVPSRAWLISVPTALVATLAILFYAHRLQG